MTSQSTVDMTWTVSLEAECSHGACTKMATSLYDKLATGEFDECAAMPLPDILEWEAEHRTARKRANRAERRGYRFGVFCRERHLDDIFEINTSVGERQGRPMSAGYLKRPTYGALPEYPCERHRIMSYGVTYAGKLVAYMYLYACGQLRLCSTIIGHAAHLENEVMYLLFRGMLAEESARDRDGIVVYHRWDSGKDGLRFYKERVGLREMGIAWAR